MSTLQTFPSKTPIIKFKAVFEDSTITFVDADSFRNAAIVMVAGRIKAKKSQTIIGLWSKAEGSDWEKVAKNSILINL